jgi:hypothetical protein
MLLVVWRKAIILGLSLELPVRELINIMSIEVKSLETEEFTV